MKGSPTCFGSWRQESLGFLQGHSLQMKMVSMMMRMGIVVLLGAISHACSLLELAARARQLSCALWEERVRGSGPRLSASETSPRGLVQEIALDAAGTSSPGRPTYNDHVPRDEMLLR